MVKKSISDAPVSLEHGRIRATRCCSMACRLQLKDRSRSVGRAVFGHCRPRSYHLEDLPNPALEERRERYRRRWSQGRGAANIVTNRTSQERRRGGP